MCEGNAVQDHIKDMTELFDELSVVGDPVSKEDRVVHLLASLPESYSMLVTVLEANTDIPKLKSLLNTCYTRKADKGIVQIRMARKP